MERRVQQQRRGNRDEPRRHHSRRPAEKPRRGKSGKPARPRPEQRLDENHKPDRAARQPVADRQKHRIVERLIVERTGILPRGDLPPEPHVGRQIRKYRRSVNAVVPAVHRAEFSPDPEPQQQRAPRDPAESQQKTAAGTNPGSGTLVGRRFRHQTVMSSFSLFASSLSREAM